jgi:hypothetical protein
MVAAEVSTNRAFVEVQPPSVGARLSHLLVGNVRARDYVHLASDRSLEQFRVRGSESRRTGAVKSFEWKLPLILSRTGEVVRVYSDRRWVCDVPVHEGPVEVACAWEKLAPESTGPCIRVQKADSLRFSDDFMRASFGGGDGWQVRSGSSYIEQAAEEGTAPNAFSLRVQTHGAPAQALAGYDFWNNYLLEVALNPEEQSELGLLFGCADKDTYYRADLSRSFSGGGAAVIELVSVEHGRATTLESRRVMPASGRWVRLGVVAEERRPVRISLDGVCLIERDLDRATFGQVGLCADGGGGRFDDFSVCSLAERSNQNPMQPVAQYSKAFLYKPWHEHDGPLYRWAREGNAWKVTSIQVDGTRLNGLLNSTLLFGDFRLQMRGLEDNPTVLALQDVDGGCLHTQRLGSSGDTVQLERTGDGLLLDGQRIGALPKSQGVQVGVYAAKGYVPPSKYPTILSATVVQEFFETAPTRWQPVSGAWQLNNRWACDPRWNFFTGAGSGDVILFSKERYDGNQCHEFFYALKDIFARQYQHRRYARHDVNFSFCTNGRDLSSGYTVMFGGRDNAASYLLKGDKIVAMNGQLKFPTGDDETQLHWEWWCFRVEKLGRRIRVLHDENLMFDWTDPEANAPALPTGRQAGGHIALWTYQNGVVYARIKTSAETLSNAAEKYLQCPAEARRAGWSSLDPFRVRLEPAPAGSIRVRNLFGGGAFAVRWELKTPVNLAQQPRLRLPFQAHGGAKVNLHAVIGGRPMIFGVNAPTSETHRILGYDLYPSISFLAFAAVNLEAPLVEERGFLDEEKGVIEVNLLAEAKRRFPYIAEPTLTSLVVGNSSNEGYLLVGFGGNTSESWYELGPAQFLPPL